MIVALFGAVILAASSLPVQPAGAAVPFRTAQPGTFRGAGFDACSAPSTAAMKAWRKSSPYRAVGIYLGGANRACAQPNLTAAWVKEQVRIGWRLVPFYVGPQATCTTASGNRAPIDNAHAGAQGSAAAAGAVAQAARLGLGRKSVIIYDMEAYRTNDPACRRGVLAFMQGWTARLHRLGYFSGFYCSVNSGIRDQVAHYSTAGYARPDYLALARWDRKVTVADPVIPSAAWPGHRRMKQYRGGHRETWGGVTINIDNDYLDFAVPPARNR